MPFKPPGKVPTTDSKQEGDVPTKSSQLTDLPHFALDRGAVNFFSSCPFSMDTPLFLPCIQVDSTPSRPLPGTLSFLSPVLATIIGGDLVLLCLEILPKSCIRPCGLWCPPMIYNWISQISVLASPTSFLLRNPAYLDPRASVGSPPPPLFKSPA